MLHSTLLTVAAIIQVVTLSAVTALDPGRYTIGRGDLFLIPGAGGGDVFVKKAGEVTPVWDVRLVTENTDAGTAETLYTFQFETAAVDPKRYMTYKGTAIAGVMIQTQPTPRSFFLELAISNGNIHRIYPAKGSNLAICRSDSSIYARFGAVDNNKIDENDPDLWSFTLQPERQD